MQHQIKCICTALYLVLFILTKLVVCYMYPHVNYVRNTPTFMMRVVGSIVWFCVHNLLALPFTGKHWHSFIFCLWSYIGALNTLFEQCNKLHCHCKCKAVKHAAVQSLHLLLSGWSQCQKAAYVPWSHSFLFFQTILTCGKTLQMAVMALHNFFIHSVFPQNQ